MKSLAIIPARGGSQRIVRKNIRGFHGKPIIEYPISAALESDLFDEVMVSTDDQEIAEIARKAGAQVPFMRSPANSNDQAGLVEVLLEVLEQYHGRGHTPVSFACLYATAALLKPNRLQEASTLMNQKKLDSVVAVTRFGFPIQRALKCESGLLSFFDNRLLSMRTQDLTPTYHDCGQFFFCDRQSFIQKRMVITEKSGALILPETEAQDIDNEDDWTLAEIKYEFMRRLNDG